MRAMVLFVLAALAQTVPGPAGLTASERALVEGSREAIIKTGLSAGYFDTHFRVARVFDRPGDRRVVWAFSVGGYEAAVNDSVGFYTEGGRRFDTHSVAGTLNNTSDLTRTITRARAERIMRRCIGRFDDPRIEYRAHGPRGVAALLLTAQSTAPRRAKGLAARERDEREGRERARRAGTGGDLIEEEDEGGRAPFVILGAVDLATGVCTKGRAVAGPERPPARR